MNNFHKRVIEENEQLKEKTAKLIGFKNSDAFNGINAIQRTLLNVQLQAMITYSECLSERLLWL